MIAVFKALLKGTHPPACIKPEPPACCETPAPVQIGTGIMTNRELKCFQYRRFQCTNCNEESYVSL
jgi:hypothetical protein